MKSVIFALVAALLIAGQIFTPAAAAPLAATCGDTYVVQRGDYLSKIAKNCGVSLSTIIAANPEIKNTSLIFPGQVIRLKNDQTIPVTGGTYTVVSGDTLSKLAVRFGTTVTELLRVNPSIKSASLIFVGQVINLPAGSTSNSTSSGTARVSLSSLSVAPGGQVTVTISGFPKSAAIDLRIGKQGAAYTAVVDGTTNSSGAATVTMTVPSAAVKGEKWVIRVLTTELTRGTEVTSAAITIK